MRDSQPLQPMPRKPRDPDTGDLAASKVQPLLEPQRAAPPLAVAGERIAQLRPDALVVRRAADGGDLAKVALDRGSGVGALADGSLVAVEQGESLKGSTRFARLGPKATKPAHYTGLFSYAFDRLGHVFTGATADVMIWVPPGKNAELAALDAPGKATSVGRLELDSSGGSVLAQLPDRSLVHYASRDRAFVRSAQGKPARKFAFMIDGTSPDHVAAGPGADQIWTTGKGALHLLDFADPIRTIAKADTGGAIYHLAAAGPRAVVLIPSSERAHTDLSWTVAAFDSQAKPAWRVPIELPGSAPRWIVASATHVAVGDATTIIVLDATSGKQLYRA
jgi:hypothetical protein